MSDGFDIKELKNFEKKFIDLATTKMPKESKKFMQSEGTKLKKKTLAKAKQKVKKDSGNYHKSIKRGKVYKYEDSLSIRAYSGDAKAHLLENGHRLVKNGEEIGFVEGEHVFSDAEKEFEQQYYSDVQKFIDDMLDKGL